MALLLSTTSPYKMSWHDLPKKNICFIDVSYQYLELTKSLKKTNSMLLQNELAHQILTK